MHRELLSIVLIVVSLVIPAGTAALAEQANSIEPAAALQRLMEGNQRFQSGHPLHQRYSTERWSAMVAKQKPFAVIVACSDSRTAPEILFDQGLGDLFVVRLAGNVVDSIAIESAGYSVEHLGTPLVCVLGHERCGAVTAAVDEHGLAPGLEHLMAAIEPAVTAARRERGDLLHNAIRENVRLVMRKLRNASELAPHVARGKVMIVGGVYDLESGRVGLLDDRPAN